MERVRRRSHGRRLWAVANVAESDTRATENVGLRITEALSQLVELRVTKTQGVPAARTCENLAKKNPTNCWVVPRM